MIEEKASLAVKYAIILKRQYWVFLVKETVMMKTLLRNFNLND